MDTLTHPQLRTIFASLKALGYDAEIRAGLVDAFSQGRTESTAKLYAEEAKALIDHLRQEQDTAKLKGDVCNQLRRGVIAAAHNMRWYIRGSTGLLITKDGRAQIDYSRIDAYCLTHTACKIKLNDQSKEQLEKTLHQFKNMANAYLKSPNEKD